jgi:hypothetical protein
MPIKTQVFRLQKSDCTPSRPRFRIPRSPGSRDETDAHFHHLDVILGFDADHIAGRAFPGGHVDLAELRPLELARHRDVVGASPHDVFLFDVNLFPLFILAVLSVGTRAGQLRHALDPLPA